ncbi:MAG: NADH-quinone oxidoreductase subunit NuoK [Desulfobulbaceae bacterium]|nr:NADH-quinone oxidoreductase subunit NuoK [Desulfobulbaceae bacterium]
MIVSYGEVLGLAVCLFFMGMICVATRRNLIMILIGVEIMLNASGIAFVGAALRWRSLDGQAFVLFLMAVAAAEVAVGLALIVYAHRHTGTINGDKYNLMKG